MVDFAAWDAAEASALIDSGKAQLGAMLPLLHALQARFGYIDDAAIPLIASALNVSKAETIGVVSFYHDFRRSPSHRPVLWRGHFRRPNAARVVAHRP